MISNGVISALTWTQDCMGKQDYDGPIVHVSTRYWPDYTAHSAILIGETEIFKKDFIGSSEVECKVQVEAWVRERTVRILRAIESVLAVPEADNG